MPITPHPNMITQDKGSTRGLSVYLYRRLRLLPGIGSMREQCHPSQAHLELINMVGLKKETGEFASSTLKASFYSWRFLVIITLSRSRINAGC